MSVVEEGRVPAVAEYLVRRQALASAAQVIPGARFSEVEQSTNSLGPHLHAQLEVVASNKEIGRALSDCGAVAVLTRSHLFMFAYAERSEIRVAVSGPIDAPRHERGGR